MRITRRAPEPPSIQVVRWLGRGTIEGRYVWEAALVRLPDGSTDVYEIPRRLGGAA